MAQSSQATYGGHPSHAVMAAASLTAVPALVMWWFQSSGRVDSLLLSLLLGVGVSAATAWIGATLWARHPGSQDVVFADLLPWGLVKRVQTTVLLRNPEARLRRRSSRFCHNSRLSPERQIRILKSLASALEARDPYTHGHTARVARHSHMIAKAMKLSREEIEMIRTAAAVHDVGKLFVPVEVLRKPGSLNEDEYAAMKEHAARGAELVAEVGNAELTALVRHHHERLDGRGYPDGLSEEAIPLGARIIAVADTFDAITSTRSYRNAVKHEEAIAILKNASGSQLDPSAVEAFLDYYAGRKSVAWWAGLSTGIQSLGAQLFATIRGAGLAGLTGLAAATGAGVLTAGVVFNPDPSAGRVWVVTSSEAPRQGSVFAAFSEDTPRLHALGAPKKSSSRTSRPTRSNLRAGNQPAPAPGETNAPETGSGTPPTDGGPGGGDGDPVPPIVDLPGETVPNSGVEPIDEAVESGSDSVGATVDAAQGSVGAAVGSALDIADYEAPETGMLDDVSLSGP
jgi:HD domain